MMQLNCVFVQDEILRVANENHKHFLNFMNGNAKCFFTLLLETQSE